MARPIKETPILNDEDADEPTRLLYFDLNDLDEE